MIEEVKGQDPLYESMHDYDDDTISGDGLLGPDDSHFYGSLNASEKTKATRSASPKSSTVNNTSSPDLLSILKKASVPVAVSFFLAYFVLSLFSAGIFITLLAFMVSVLTVGIGLTAEKRYSIAGGYYWSEREGTTGEKIFVFLFCFLLITVFFLDGVPINARFCLFATGLAALVIIVHRSWTSGAL